MPGSSGRFNLYVEGFVVLMSVSIDVCLVMGPGGELALSPALDNSPGSLYVASAECVELKELAEEGRTFEEWVVEDFIGDLEEYLDDLKDSVFIVMPPISGCGPGSMSVVSACLFSVTATDLVPTACRILRIPGPIIGSRWTGLSLSI